MPNATDHDTGFPLLARKDLAEVMRAGAGVVLVDHFARTNERPSVLHAATCRWLGAVGPYTALRFSTDERAALHWLNRNRRDGDFWQRCSHCRGRGVLGAQDASHLPQLGLGDVVAFDSPVEGVGTIVSTTSAMHQVALFAGPGGEEDIIEVTAEGVRRHVPRSGDLAWFEVDGTWRRGEVFRSAHDEALVYDGTTLVDMPHAQFRTRRFEPVDDPLAALIEGFCGDLSAVEARRAFLTAYHELTRAAPGLAGVVSAGVSLFPHQIGAVRRVLDDPVQRYLLADEVGLGKTIEAGLLIRQRLVDAPRSVVVVLVPAELVAQWEDELQDRLGLRWFRRAGIDVVSHEEALSWKRLQVPDLVIIDEAHRIAAGWRSPVRETAERYEAAKRLTTQSARVLLLSATPVLNRERDLLAMLHLLDPDNFALEDLDSFTDRVRRRAEIGRLYLNVASGTPSFLLADSLSEISAEFPDDDDLARLIKRIDVDDDGDRREQALADVRSHLSDRYRLHARLIRNRRTGIASRTYSVRGRTQGARGADDDPRRRRVDGLLEEFRAELVTSANDEGEEWIGTYAEAFWSFVQASTGDLQCLRHLAEYRLNLRRAHLDRSGVGPAARGAVKSIKLTEGTRAVLERIVRDLQPLDFEGDQGHEAADVAGIARSLVAMVIRPAVIYTSARATASALSVAMEQLLGEPTYALTAEMNIDERRSLLGLFRAGQIPILVCDATGEEGLNLQDAASILHADLPRSTGRIEQRIGRADRHGGRREPVACGLLAPAGGFGAAWLSLVAEVFGVFNTSTAASMFAVEEVERMQQRAWFLDGLPADLEAHLDHLRALLAEEQQRIDRLDEFDLLANKDLSDQNLVERVLDAERFHADAFFDATCELAAATKTALQLDLRTDDGIVLDGMVGRVTTATKRRLELRRAGGSLVRAARGARRRRSGRARPAGRTDGGDAPGAKRLDEASQIAVVRLAASGRHETVAIRADLLVRADVSGAIEHWRAAERDTRTFTGAVRTDADAPLALAALQRRVDAFLPAQHVTVWIGEDGSPISEVSAVEALELDIARADSDSSWSSDDVRDLGGILGTASGIQYLRDAGPTARAAAIAACAPPDVVERARNDARTAWSERVGRLRQRQRGGDLAAGREANAEEAVNAYLLAALSRPAATWSSVTLLVVTDAS